MGQQRYVSTDPNFGVPIAEKGYVSTDPNFGEPLRVASKGENVPAEKPPTWSDRLGLNQPTDSMIHGFHRGVGSAAVDMAQGAASSLLRMANAFAGVEDQGTAAAASLVGKSYQPEPLVEMPPPDTVPGTVGAVLPDVAMAAMPASVGAAAVKQALPSAARAGANFEKVMGAAKNIPIESKEVGDVALRIYQLSERGGTMPKAVRDILKRMTDPNKAAMTYEESRDFASNISRLSADEMQRLTPVLKREVAQLSAALNKANAEAAKAAGKGAEYKSAMREYAKAKQLSDALDTVIRKAKKAALPAAGLGGAAYWLGRD